jgi:hypothetical protein
MRTTCFNNQELCILPTEFIYVFHMILTVNSINKLIFVMVKCGVFFAVRTEFLNII